jgi:hypothetical protein
MLEHLSIGHFLPRYLGLRIDDAYAGLRMSIGA